MTIHADCRVERGLSNCVSKRLVGAHKQFRNEKFTVGSGALNVTKIECGWLYSESEYFMDTNASRRKIYQL